MQRYENELRNQKIEDLGPTEAELEAERLRVRESNHFYSVLQGCLFIFFVEGTHFIFCRRLPILLTSRADLIFI